MATKENINWKRINMGDTLPCQSFLRKKNGEILKLSTVGGVKVGQDCYYLPVDEVINVIKDYPVEESKDERIRKAIYDCVKWFGFDSCFFKDVSQEECLDWIEKQGQTFTKKDVDDAYLKGVCDAKQELEKRSEQKPYCLREECKDCQCNYAGECKGSCAMKRNEQKPILDVELPFGAKDSELEEVSYSIPNGYHAEIEDNKVVIKKGEQKPADNIESSAFKDKLLELFQKFRYIKESVPTNGDIIDYVDAHIQELIDTIQKPAEWNEEDENWLIEAINVCEIHDYNETAEWLKNRLKSLRPQSRWNPSEGQLVALNCAITAASDNLVCLNVKDLESLYNELKKLKG